MGKYGVGIVGFGNRGIDLGKAVIDYFPSSLRLEGYMDTSEKALTAAGEWMREFGGKTAGSMEEFLGWEGLDVVLICTPQFAHAEAAIQAMRAGKHVFVEKPMGLSLDECDGMLSARDEASCELFVGFNLRHHPLCMKIKELIDSGCIGLPQTIVCNDFFAGGGGYFRRWHRFHKNSGGLLLEKGCHSLDLINWFVDSPPAFVSAFGGLNVFTPRPEAAKNCRDCDLIGSCVYAVDLSEVKAVVEKYGQDLEQHDICVYNSEKDTTDNHLVIIEYENGCRAAYAESFASRVLEKSGRQFAVNGHGGQLWCALVEGCIDLYFSHRGKSGGKVKYSFAEPEGGHGGADNIQLRHIVDCLDGKTPNLLPGENGRDAVLLAEAAETGARERRVVDVRSGRPSVLR